MFPHSSKCENVGTNLRFIPKDGPAPHFPDHPRAINIIPSCRLNLQSRAKGLVKAARISGRRPTSGPSPPLDAINHVTWHEKAQGVEKFTTRKRVVAFLSLTNPGYSDEKRNGSYCELYPGMEKIGRAVGAFTTNLGQSLSFRNSFSPRDSPRKSGVEDRGLSGLDRRQREKGFFFPKFTKSNGPGIHEGYTHLDPSRDRFFHASPCSISISDEITYFSIVGNTPRDFLLVFFLFLGKGKENSKGYGAHNGPTFHRWSMGNCPRPGFLESWFPIVLLLEATIIPSFLTQFNFSTN